MGGMRIDAGGVERKPGRRSPALVHGFCGQPSPKGSRRSWVLNLDTNSGIAYAIAVFHTGQATKGPGCEDFHRGEPKHQARSFEYEATSLRPVCTTKGPI